MTKIIRATTVPGSLNNFCRGLLSELKQDGYEIVGLSSPGDDLHEVEEREAIRCVPVSMERRISPFKDFKSLINLIRIFHREKPDIVHSMTPKAGLLCMMAGWITGVPLRVHTFTGLVFPTSTGIKRPILMATDWLTCACATHIIPEGEGVKNDLINHKITGKSLKVLGHGNVKGIDLKHFDPQLPEVQSAAAKIRKEGTLTFISIGRLVGDKGINELVEAFAKINLQYPATRLIIVGSEEKNIDPLKPSTIEEIKRNHAIEAVGQQSDVRPWLAASDVFVLSSYREGFPNVVIEAGAMNLPSIVTDINGAREIIIDGRNGIIVPPRQTDTLRRAMELFVKDPGLAARLAAEARPLIASRYEQSYVRSCLKEYYNEILNNKQ